MRKKRIKHNKGSLAFSLLRAVGNLKQRQGSPTALVPLYLVKLAPRELIHRGRDLGSHHEGTVILSIHSVRIAESREIRDHYWLAEDPYSASTPREMDEEAR